MPPIFQPEVAARAIVYAAENPRRREYWVGGSTAATIVGEKFVPGLIDRYLGRTGVTSQQTDEKQPSGVANLWKPADENRDYGAHGSFDDRSKDRSFQVWLSQHRDLVVAGAGGAVAAALAVFATGRRR